MIPKVIHYCWFGRNPKPEIVLHCIESWKKYCPDYEIIEWNEDNFNVNQHPFMKAAYDAKKWAYVADVARLIVVYENGGVYLDTDVELYRSLNQHLCYDGFFSFESLTYINSGLGFGGIPRNPIIGAMLDSYNMLTFGQGKPEACPKVNTSAIMAVCPELERNGNKTQVINNNIFYSAADYSMFAKHLYMMSWIDGTKHEKGKRKRSKFSMKAQSFFQTPEKIQFMEKHFGGKGLKIYTFFAYDFFDCGIWYFCKRALNKLKSN